MRQLGLWNKIGRDIWVNAGSMMGSTLVTSGLGFVYWWIAARRFSPEAVGFASATISAMVLLGTLGMMGLGTLLMSELPAHVDRRGSLITTALLVAGAVAAVFGGLFVLIAPLISHEFRPLGTSAVEAGLFIVGVVLSAITLVFDQALVGMLRGDLQLWRNTMFAFVKLLALIVFGFVVSSNDGLAIYITWTIGNIVSFGWLVGIVRRHHVKIEKPRWDWLRNLPGVALAHHALNLALQLTNLTLPIVVTMLLSAELNASFYIAWLIANLVYAIPYTLTTVLFAIEAQKQGNFAEKLRVTLSTAFNTAVVVVLVLWISAPYVLSVFGHGYTQQSVWALRLLGLGVFPIIIKDHFIAISRVRGDMRRVAVLIMLGSGLELLLAAIGARLDGLHGISIGFVAALVIEAVLMAIPVYRAARRQTTGASGS